MEKSFGERVADAKGAVKALSARQAYELMQHATVAFVDPRPPQAIVSTTGLIPGAWNVNAGGTWIPPASHVVVCPSQGVEDSGRRGLRA